MMCSKSSCLYNKCKIQHDLQSLQLLLWASYGFSTYFCICYYYLDFDFVIQPTSIYLQKLFEYKITIINHNNDKTQK